MKGLEDLKKNLGFTEIPDEKFLGIIILGTVIGGQFNDARNYHALTNKGPEEWISLGTTCKIRPRPNETPLPFLKEDVERKLQKIKEWLLAEGIELLRPWH